MMLGPKRKDIDINVSENLANPSKRKN